MTTIYELDGRYFETRAEAEDAEKNAYYTYFPIKERETSYSFTEWESRFETAKKQGADIDGAATFAFSDLDLEES